MDGENNKSIIEKIGDIANKENCHLFFHFMPMVNPWQANSLEIRVETYPGCDYQIVSTNISDDNLLKAVKEIVEFANGE